MPFVATEFPGLLVFEPFIFKDERGYFFESYNQKLFQQNGAEMNFVQDNQSHSNYGVLRGLHYQLNPYSQTKLVRVLKGNILDVVADIRRGSPTYGKTYSIELSDENKKQLLVPKGFAHGFVVLSETADVMYKCDGFYNKASEAGIIYDDDFLNIDWKVPAQKIKLSPKDLELPSFENCMNNFQFVTL
ncbi:MAG: dTDP-4-dehydrorhamnose 3,5-epimerase [Bacteroidetes bacterium]|nr:dTDP-4-dehydrorhamnose 3,5-epimerase [Bacteroidota bacterium]MBS1973464.1 dTDP-4-dehydrorhamnose 3,5-epimerase [Bacteroidota bacterium]